MPAKLWSDETPNLYTCRVTVGGDVVEEPFGIRKLEWSPKGFFVNGKETLLRGGCVHHDNGIVGAATYDESEWRRVPCAGHTAGMRDAYFECADAFCSDGRFVEAMTIVRLYNGEAERRRQNAAFETLKNENTRWNDLQLQRDAMSKREANTNV